MHRCEALIVMTTCELRGARQNSMQRATAVSIVTASKDRPNNSARGVSLMEVSARRGSLVVGVPKVGPLSFNLGRGGLLAHQQAGVLVRPQKAPELTVVVARQALEPAPQIPPEHRDATDQRRVNRHA